MKKPARSEEDKERVKQQIIKEGRKLFVKKGSYEFSTYALAEKLGMVQGNLYNYFKSKRELYIQIRIEDFKKLRNEMERIVEEHKGSYLDLIRKLIRFYLDFARNEYKRFQMMFFIPPPPSSKIGPIEKNYEVIDPLGVVKRIVQEGIKAGEIKNLDVKNLTFYFYALVQGATSVERDLRTREKVLEPIDQDTRPETIENFREFLIEQLIDQIKAT
jgi:AcrR family transcriptional regulator